MQKMTITTNGHARDLLSVSELPAAVAEEFDYVTGEDVYSPRIVRYKGDHYDVSEFTTTSELHGGAGHHDLSEWDGYQSDTYFSGTVIRYVNDYEQVVVGTYFG